MFTLGVPWSASRTVLGQVTPKFARVSVLRIGIPVDCFVAGILNRASIGPALQLQPACNLFKRPSVLDPLNDGVPQLWQSYQFTQIIPAFPRLVIGRRTILARKIRHLDIVKTIASQLTENR